MICLTVLGCGLLAYSNGANDNFKGVATLFGSGTTNYKGALIWATITTFAGSLCSVVLAGELVRNFSGKGLVSDNLAGAPEFLLSVVCGAGLTVLFATLLGFPISTTHSITGALAGAGFAAVGTQMNFSKLGISFFIPLLLTPLIAVLTGVAVYLLFRYARIKFGIEKEFCICVGESKKQYIPVIKSDGVFLAPASGLPVLILDKIENCEQRYSGVLF
ncbi:MAG: inorganic phosphate transporter, partial [Planctomycetes bacterium]|nr:inorganic phosphate transporter [Planctomycetota bacterium]